MKRLAVLGAALLLSACTPVPTPVVFVAKCPEVSDYSKDFQTQFGDYLAKLPPSAVMDRYLSDSESLRDQAKACINTVRAWKLDKVAAKKR